MNSRYFNNWSLAWVRRSIRQRVRLNIGSRRLADHNETQGEDGSILQRTVEGSRTITETTTTIKDVDVPKLTSSKTEEYERWKRSLRWWASVTKIEKEAQAAQVILNAIMDSEVHEVALNMDPTRANAAEGLDKLIATLDAHFKPNTFIRKLSLWDAFRKHEKKEDKSWLEYIKVFKRLRVDLKYHKLEISDELFCIAILTGTNLDPNNRLNAEGVARNSDPNHRLTVKGLEDALLRLKSTTEVSESLYCAEDQEEEQINWARWQKWVKQQEKSQVKKQEQKGKSGAKRKQDEGCFVCGKMDHFARQCPESHINKKGKKREEKPKGESYIGYSKTNKSESDDEKKLQKMISSVPLRTIPANGR